MTDRLLEAFIVSAATEVGDRMTPVMMFCFAPEDAHVMHYKPVPGELCCNKVLCATMSYSGSLVCTHVVVYDFTPICGCCTDYIRHIATIHVRQPHVATRTQAQTFLFRTLSSSNLVDQNRPRQQHQRKMRRLSLL